MKRFIPHIILLFSLVYINAVGKNPYYANDKSKTCLPDRQAQNKALMAPCSAPTSSVDLNINNVRAKMLGGGDMWWDLNNAVYEIPKGSGKHSIFAGALWIGGISSGKQLKFAGQTYRAAGEDDFWPGPLDNTANTDAIICSGWNKHFPMRKTEIDSFIANPANMSLAIKEWPAKNNPYNTLVGNRDLAPFVDVNGDGNYNPDDGDYPDIVGEQFIWWIFNDNGNTHTNTGGAPLGIEVHAQAFATNSTADLSDMTFYRYKIINRSANTLYNTFIGQFVDPDLGCYLDDYVGCDPSRDLGFCYNGDSLDASCGNPPVPGYSPDLAAVGLRLLETPNDDAGNRLGMSVFATYTNGQSVNGDPQIAGEYYNYLMGRWRDNTEMTYGGIGFNGATPTKYMYPGTPCDTSQWSEWSNVNDPGDRRFLMSSGPFTLQPGQVVYMSFAVVWAIVTNGTDPCEPVALLKTKSDLAQTYFNNNFPTFIQTLQPAKTINKLTIMPHPVDDQAIITFNNNKKIEHFKLYDILGKVVKNYANLSLNQLVFKRGYLPDGIYFYKVTDDSGLISNGKIVVQ